MNPSIRFVFNKVWGLGMAGEMHAICSWDTETVLNAGCTIPAPKLVSTTHVLHVKIFVFPLLITLDIPLWMTEDET